MNLLTFPPTLIKRAIDDLAAIGDAARRLPQVEAQLLNYVDKLTTEIVAVREGVDGLRVEMAPIQELPAVRRAVEPLSGKLDAMQERLDALIEEVEPIQEISKVREGIEPLDDDMRSVRDSVDNLEPLIERMAERIGALDKRLESIQSDIAPLGELAEKIPGVG
jgi:chromosome segregation ATPase